MMKKLTLITCLLLSFNAFSQDKTHHLAGCIHDDIALIDFSDVRIVIRTESRLRILPQVLIKPHSNNEATHLVCFNTVYDDIDPILSVGENFTVSFIKRTRKQINDTHTDNKNNTAYEEIEEITADSINGYVMPITAEHYENWLDEWSTVSDPNYNNTLWYLEDMLKFMGFTEEKQLNNLDLFMFSSTDELFYQQSDMKTRAFFIARHGKKRPVRFINHDDFTTSGYVEFEELELRDAQSFLLTIKVNRTESF